MPPIITCLVDNTASGRLWGEHGLAMLVETEAGRVLFDTGHSGTVLMHNLDQMSIAPRSLDAIAISHAHDDHTGGLATLLPRCRPRIPLYAHADLFHERFARRGDTVEAIGVPLSREALAAQVTLRLSAEPQAVLPGVWTTGEIVERPEPEGGSPHLLVRAGNAWAADPYRDDLSLVVEVPSGLILLCGCCHAGLLNTLAHVRRIFNRPVVLIAGGTHLVSASGNHVQRVRAVLAGMASLRRVYLSHCSGERVFVALVSAFGHEFVRSCPSGTRLDLTGCG